MVIVAQLVRALVCGTRGRGFEPRLSPHQSFLDKQTKIIQNIETHLLGPYASGKLPLLHRGVEGSIPSGSTKIFCL